MGGKEAPAGYKALDGGGLKEDLFEKFFGQKDKMTPMEAFQAVMDVAEANGFVEARDAKHDHAMEAARQEMFKHYEAAWKLKEEIDAGKDFSSKKEGVAKVWENFCHSVSQVCKKIMHWVEDKRAKSALGHLADVMEEKTTAQWFARKCEAAAKGMSHMKDEVVKAGKGFAAKASQAANKVLHPNHARRVAPAPSTGEGKGGRSSV